jgi:predicted nucleic acid-binding protein
VPGVPDDIRFLVDNSAMNRLQLAPVEKVLVPLLMSKKLSTCGAIEVEALYSARNSEEYESLKLQRGSILEYLDTTEDDWQTALMLQGELVKKSQHRGPKVPDLIISAVAINNGLTVLHYDSDFERIANYTELEAEWVVPRGSV